MKKLAGLIATGALLVSAVAVFAHHNGAIVTTEIATCSETTFTAEIADPAGTHKVGNMRLVVYDGDSTYFTNVIPTDGSDVSISVGPFSETTTVKWRVFGGDERDYDIPSWTGYGGATFSADINTYGSANGWSWVLAGPDDPNPFTTWNSEEVGGCAPEKIGKVTGGLTLGGPQQQISFNAFDNGDSSFDKGRVEYQNFEYAGGLHYTTDILCASVDKNTKEARFMFQIPEGWSISGLYVVSYTKDGGTPGTKGDLYGHGATGDFDTAMSWCESGFSPTDYQVTGGNLVVHK